MDLHLAVAVAAGVPAAAAAFAPMPAFLRRQGPVVVDVAAVSAGAVFAAATVAAVVVADAGPLAGPFVLAGAAVTASEVAEGRIPHIVSAAAAVAVTAVAVAQSGWHSLAAAAVAAVFCLAAGWMLGRGPLGGVSAAGRAMQHRGRPLLVGGGDPAWLAVVTAAAAASGAARRSRVTEWLLPEGGLLSASWQHAWMAVCAALLATGALAALSAAVPSLRGQTYDRIKMGPAAAAAAVIVTI